MLSFVIPAHNEEAHLRETIAAIHGAARASGRECEVIVTDDASTDATEAVAREAGARVVQIQARQIASARNAGAAVASGEYLFFIDADTQVTPEAISQALAALDAGAAGGGGPMRFDPPVPVWVPPVLACVQILFRLAKLTGGAFLFCTRVAFDKAGGWDESLYASEEIALAAALKKHGRFVVVRAPVQTSGRKVRTFSPLEILWRIVKVGLLGKRALQSREHLDLWYGPRRPDKRA